MQIDIRRQVSGALDLNEAELLWLAQALDAAVRGNLWSSLEPTAWARVAVETIMPQLMPGV